MARSVSFDDNDPDMPVATSTIRNDGREEPNAGEELNRSSCTVVEVNKEKLQMKPSGGERRHSLDEGKAQEEVYTV